MEEVSLQKLPGFVPGNAKYVWIKPSEVIPAILEQTGALSPDEIELVQKICTQSEYRYFIEKGVWLESKDDYGLSCPYVYAGELKELLQQTLRELESSKPKDEIFLTLEQKGEWGEYFYKFSFNIPTEEERINKKVIKDAVQKVESLRKVKKEEEKKRAQKKLEEEIAEKREAELGRLIVSLQIGKITPEEFKAKSDAIYDRK